MPANPSPCDECDGDGIWCLECGEVWEDCECEGNENIETCHACSGSGLRNFRPHHQQSEGAAAPASAGNSSEQSKQ